MPTATTVTWWLDDADHTLARVRLLAGTGAPEDFARADGGWELRLDRPPVHRIEYRLELHHADGGREEICDPANPLRVPGAFGDKSVVELPEYAAPEWLAADAPSGDVTELAVPARTLRAEVAVRLWSPAGTTALDPLPLLVAHDGPEYDRLGSLTTFAAAQIHARRLPPHRLALLGPGDRNLWYAANPRYADALATAVLPAIRNAVAVAHQPVGLGVSLGGLAMLHFHRRYPDRLGGLFLQSGSFFDPRLDPQESGFSGFKAVTRFVADVRRGLGRIRPVPVTLTCGAVEENLANNRQLAATLTAQGYPATLVEVPDAHNYVAWRDALDPALIDLLTTVWNH